MRLMIVIFISFVSTLGSAKSSKSKVRYPNVQFIEGRVEQVEDVITIENRQPKHLLKEQPVTKNTRFKDKLVLRTFEKSSLRLGLSPTSSLVIYENSEIKIPEIAWKDGAVKEIQLGKGALRIFCQSGCDRNFVSPLYEGVLPAGEYLLEYDPSAPRAQLSVIVGEAVFGGLGNEKNYVLKTGERASFTGEFENEQLSFDVLLKGRKAAKGKTSEITKVPAELIESFQKQDQEQIKVAKKAVKSKRKSSQICDKPWGELNQCVWTCEKNKKGAKECLVSQGAQCVRMRCNANGEWTDRQELSGTQSSCRAESFVGACDY